MRQRFSHYLPLAQEDLDRIWDAAILTVDANVLLDLYRYHDGTRDRILSALGQFRGRLWLTHQAAEEFFRNRRAVIANANNDFDQADTHLKQFEKELSSVSDKLHGCRLVARELVAALTQGVKHELETARTSLKLGRDARPDYLSADSLLDSILSLFEGAVGPEPSENDRAVLAKEAERRKAQKIPPGFRDDKKDGDKSHGDYFLWSQVLAHAATEARPVILVTSEQKEDWWEKQHGRRLAPRCELLDEAAKVAKQRVLLYEADYFLSLAEGRHGRKVEQSVLAEIRSVAMKRIQPSLSMTSDPEEIVTNALESLASGLVDSDDQITSLIAETNASGFYADQIEVTDVGPFDFAEARLPFQARIYFTGEQNEDSMFCGDKIIAEISGELSFDGSRWEICDAYELHAALEDYGEEPPED